jgi:hypothetical protein
MRKVQEGRFVERRAVLFQKMNVLACTMIIAFAMCGCSNKSTDPPPDPWPERLAALNAAHNVQAGYAVLWDSLIMTLDTVTVLDSLVVLMLQDSTIDTAWASSEAIWIAHRCGMLGGVVINVSELRDTLRVTAPVPEHDLDATMESTVPQSKSAVFFGVCHPSRSFEEMLSAAWPYLVKAGYQHPPSVWRGTECTLARMANPAGYGIIHIDSHGWAFPSEQDVQKVFIMSGEQLNDLTNSAFYEHLVTSDPLTNELWVPAMTGHSSDAMYFFSSKFASDHWIIGSSQPVVYLGCCYSARGGWLSELVRIGALASIGFTGGVNAGWIRDQASEFYRMMCDVSRAKPVTISEWDSFLGNQYRCYNNTNVCIAYEAANPDVTLWDGYLRVVATYPANGSTGVPTSLEVITATFSNELNASTVNASTFQISPSISGDYFVEGAVARFVPSSELAENTLYTVTLQTGITDEHGHTLGEAYSWTFTTANNDLPANDPSLIGSWNLVSVNGQSIGQGVYLRWTFTATTITSTSDMDCVEVLTYSSAGGILTGLSVVSQVGSECGDDGGGGELGSYSVVGNTLTVTMYDPEIEPPEAVFVFTKVY